MLSREEAILAYNKASNQQISYNIQRLAQLDVNDRVAVAKAANEVLQIGLVYLELEPRRAPAGALLEI